MHHWIKNIIQIELNLALWQTTFQKSFFSKELYLIAPLYQTLSQESYMALYSNIVTRQVPFEL